MAEPQAEQTTAAVPATTEQSAATVEGSTEPVAEKPKLSGPELHAALVKAVEHCFSRDFIANNAQILSKMDTQTMYVTLDAVLTLPAIAALTADSAALLAAVQASPKLVLDSQNNRVRPNHTVKRNTIILREVPKDATEADVRAIMDGLGEVEQCEHEFGNIWFVRMVNESDAKNAVFTLQTKKGQKARLKSENIFRSYIGKAAPAKAAATNAKAPAATTKNPYASVNPYAPVFRPGAPFVPGAAPVFGDNEANNHIKYIAHLQQQEQMMRMQYAMGMPGRQAGGLAAPQLAGLDPNDPKHRRQIQRMYREQYGGRGGRGRGGQYFGAGGRKERGSHEGGKSGKRSKKKDGAAHQQRSHATPNFDSPEFPPLSGDADLDRRDFPHRYSSKDIVSIIKSFPRQLLTRPESMEKFAKSGIVLEEPMEDLVKKQRTTSMDEVDKALRHGQSIRVERAQSEDYSDMFYGNASHRSGGGRRRKARSTPVVDAPAPSQAAQPQQQRAKGGSTTDAAKTGKDASAGAAAPASAPSSSSSTPKGPWVQALARGKGSGAVQGKNSKKKQASREAAQAKAAAAAAAAAKPSGNGDTAGSKKNSKPAPAPVAAASTVNAPWAAAAKANKPSSRSASTTPQKARRPPSGVQSVPNSPSPSSSAPAPASSGPAPAPAPAVPAQRPQRGWERPGTAPILPKPKPKPKPVESGGDGSDGGSSAGNSRRSRGGDRNRRKGEGNSRRGNSRAGRSPGNSRRTEQRRQQPPASANATADSSSAAPSTASAAAPAPAPAPAPTSWGGKSTFASVLKKEAKKAPAKKSPQAATAPAAGAGNLSYVAVPGTTNTGGPANKTEEAPRVGRSDESNWRRRR